MLQCVLQVVELKPQWPKGSSRVGAAAIGLGDIDKAKAAYEKGVPVISSSVPQAFTSVRSDVRNLMICTMNVAFAPGKQ